jgi:hypothetical protein
MASPPTPDAKIEDLQALRLIMVHVALLLSVGIVLSIFWLHSRNIATEIMANEPPVRGSIAEIKHAPPGRQQRVTYLISFKNGNTACTTEYVSEFSHFDETLCRRWVVGDAVDVWPRDESCAKPILEVRHRNDQSGLILRVCVIGVVTAILVFVFATYRIRRRRVAQGLTGPAV